MKVDQMADDEREKTIALFRKAITALEEHREGEIAFIVGITELSEREVTVTMSGPMGALMEIASSVSKGILEEIMPNKAQPKAQALPALPASVL